jgi:16S rRNA (uracil1498-N3)-methyltransferase
VCPEPVPANAHRFFLADPPAAGDAQAELELLEVRHAVRALRLDAGDLLWGLDGAGGAWPARVHQATKRAVVVDLLGTPSREPEPGAAGAPLPWIEVAFSPPRGSRAEDLFDALTQLGAAALRPLVTERTQGERRAAGDGRRERWLRRMREACKQSRRTWVPQLREPCTVAALARDEARSALGLATPGAEQRSAAFLRALAPELRGTRAAPLVLAVGPEGGFTDEELRALDQAGAVALGLGPHVLRTETAAQALLAGVVQSL